MNKSGQAFLDVREIIWLDVDMMCGIEYEEFPARIAEVAMWLMDHQMNMAISNEFGQYFARLPLKKAANIVHGNALKIEWESLVNKNNLSFILGNPPFIGKQMQNVEQKLDMEIIFSNLKGNGVLDYVSAWYLKSAEYIKDTRIVAAFVSTNSISQGEQAGLLWNFLFQIYNVKIHFAHRTFNWRNEAKGNAAVHVVIIGFANFNISTKRLYEYDDINSLPHEIEVKNINPYLVEGKDFAITSRTKPICNVQAMMNGSMPNDNGNFLLTKEERDDLLKLESGLSVYIKKFVGAFEYLNNHERYCIWLKDAQPNELKKFHNLMKRIEAVKDFRSNSTREATRKLANAPFLFGEIRQPNSAYLIAPVVSSINRKFIPIDIYPKEIIASNLVNIIPNASLYTLGVMSSFMMMTWIRNVAGRLKSDWRFTKDNVYNNYPWPENPSEKQILAIEEKAQKVLDVRKDFPNSSLADLYDPLTMPPSLVKAHNELDKAVDLAYRPQAFLSEAKRMEFLFELYEKYTADLFTKVKVKKVATKK
jgi:hypothetical protein